MNTIDTLELELVTTSIRMNTAEMKIVELLKELEILKRQVPYGTVVHYRNNVSTFHPWSGGLPAFENATDRKIVYLA